MDANACVNVRRMSYVNTVDRCGHRGPINNCLSCRLTVSLYALLFHMYRPSRPTTHRTPFRMSLLPLHRHRICVWLSFAFERCTAERSCMRGASLNCMRMQCSDVQLIQRVFVSPHHNAFSFKHLTWSNLIATSLKKYGLCVRTLHWRLTTARILSGHTWC